MEGIAVNFYQTLLLALHVLALKESGARSMVIELCVVVVESSHAVFYMA